MLWPRPTSCRRSASAIKRPRIRSGRPAIGCSDAIDLANRRHWIVGCTVKADAATSGSTRMMSNTWSASTFRPLTSGRRLMTTMCGCVAARKYRWRVRPSSTQLPWASVSPRCRRLVWSPRRSAGATFSCHAIADAAPQVDHAVRDRLARSGSTANLHPKRALQHDAVHLCGRNRITPTVGEARTLDLGSQHRNLRRNTNRDHPAGIRVCVLGIEAIGIPQARANGCLRPAGSHPARSRP